MDKINLQVVRDSFGRVAYTHKTHEKEAEIESEKAKRLKWSNIILLTLNFSGIISQIITSEKVLLYISAILSGAALGFVIYQLSFNPEERAERHRRVARDLWLIREKYVNLIADIMNEGLVQEQIVNRRDLLIKELSMIYKYAPETSREAYKRAGDGLKINEELTFSDKEIDIFLPAELRISKQ
jgi:hypothetical protein